MSEEKKKAEYLILRFLLKLPFDKEVITENRHGKWTYSSEELAKEHALICVDEIIKELDHDQNDFDRWRFWTRVRKELTNQ